MPFLRVVRDKRGYETTYLIHSVRDGARQESRVLYAFRSPGGVRVGRDPFEPGVRREIESSNPGIVFDWDAMVTGQHVIDSTPDPRRQRRRPGAPASGQGASTSAGRGSSPERASASPSPRAEPASQPPRLVVPGAIEGDTPETRMRFLAHWHGILCEQLPLRVADTERRDALMTIAQKLNPAGWIDADEIAVGLQQATDALERLSRLLSKRRRKPRRGGQREGRPVASGASEDDPTAASDGADLEPADASPSHEPEPE